MTDKRGFVGHPAGLGVIFFTTVWERFAFFGVKVILVYYMLKELGLSQAEASNVYGLYTGFVFFTPFFGGLIADRWLGQRRSVIIGALILICANFMLVSESLFYPALGLLVAGNGLVRPNVSCQTGGLYAPGDARRDRGYGIFYVAINLGAFFAPLVCGTLGEVYGWRYAFAAAGCAVTLGLAIYLLGQRHLPGDHPQAAACKPESDAEAQAGGLSSAERRRIIGFAVICLISSLFWMVYEQKGNILALWADSQTDRHFLGFEVPASWLQALNPFFIFFLTPVLSWLWHRQALKGREPASTVKIAFGMFFAGAACLVMIPAAWFNEQSGAQVGMLWLVGYNFLLTLGELYLSPVGLSLVSKIAPPRMVSAMMGLWFLNSFFGDYLAGYLGRFWGRLTHEEYFLLVAGLGILGGAVTLVFSGQLKKAMQECGQPGHH